MKNTFKCMLACCIINASIPAIGMQTEYKNNTMTLNSLNQDQIKQASKKAIEFYEATLNVTFFSIIKLLNDIDPTLIKMFIEDCKLGRSYYGDFGPFRLAIAVQCQALIHMICSKYGARTTDIPTPVVLEMDKIVATLYIIEPAIYTMFFPEQNKEIEDMIELCGQIVINDDLDLSSKLDAMAKLNDLFQKNCMTLEKYCINKHENLSSLFKPYSDAHLDDILAFIV